MVLRFSWSTHWRISIVLLFYQMFSWILPQRCVAFSTSLINVTQGAFPVKQQLEVKPRKNFDKMLSLFVSDLITTIP
jgi:hypothetical protein